MGHVRGREWVRPMPRKVSNSNTGLEVIEPTCADTAPATGSPSLRLRRRGGGGHGPPAGSAGLGNKQRGRPLVAEERKERLPRGRIDSNDVSVVAQAGPSSDPPRCSVDVKGGDDAGLGRVAGGNLTRRLPQIRT